MKHAYLILLLFTTLSQGSQAQCPPVVNITSLNEICENGGKIVFDYNGPTFQVTITPINSSPYTWSPLQSGDTLHGVDSEWNSIDINSFTGLSCSTNVSGVYIASGPRYYSNYYVTQNPSNSNTNNGELQLIADQTNFSSGGSNVYNYSLCIDNNISQCGDTIINGIFQGPLHTVPAVPPGNYFIEIKDTVGCTLNGFLDNKISLYGSNITHSMNLTNDTITIKDSSLGVDPYVPRDLELLYNEVPLSIPLVYYDSYDSTFKVPVELYHGNYKYQVNYQNAAGGGPSNFSSEPSEFEILAGPYGSFLQEADTSCYLEKVKFTLKDFNIDSLVWKVYSENLSPLYSDTTFTNNYFYFDNNDLTNPLSNFNFTDTIIYIEPSFLYLGDNTHYTLPQQKLLLTKNSVLANGIFNVYPKNKCFRDTFIFEMNGIPAGYYEWDFGDGVTEVSQFHQIKHSYVLSGLYPISCKIVTACGDVITVNDTLQIDLGPSLSFSTSSINTDCGLSGGVASVINVNGAAPFSYQWSTGDTTSFIDTLTSGVYLVTVTDIVGCENTSPLIISDQSGPSIGAISIDSATCPGSNDGNINLIVSGNYSFFWSTGSTDQSLQNIPAGNYYVSITDNNNCLSIDTFTVQQPLPLTLSTIATIPSGCGNDNGMIIASSTGGTLSYAYSCVGCGPFSTNPFTNLAAGSYLISVEDGNNCKTTKLVTLNDDVDASLATFPKTNTCGSSTGEIFCEFEISASIPAQTVDLTCIGGLGVNLTISQPAPGFLDTTFLNLSSGVYGITAQFLINSGDTCTLSSWSQVKGAKPIEDPICLLTVDSLNHNVVVWEKDSSLITGATHFNIYRESSTQFGQFDIIDSVDIDSLSEYTDLNSDATISSHRYKISVSDSCGIESEVSPTHTTIHMSLVGVPPINGNSAKAHISWNKYGNWHTSITAYEIYRNKLSKLDTFILISTVPVTNQNDLLYNYVDISSFDGAIYYVQILNDTVVCTATKTTDHLSSRSNRLHEGFPLSFNVIINSTGVSTEGQCNGEATANVIGGSAPYAYLWNDQQSTMSAIGLCQNTFTVTVTDNNGDTAVATENIGLTDVPNLIEFEYLKVFPNPATNQFTLELRTETNENIQLTMYSLNGQLMYQKTFTKTQNGDLRETIDVENLSKGVYFIKIQSEHHHDVRKLILK